MADSDFSGLWHSVYTYVNEIEPQGGTSEHDVKIYKTGNQLVIQSVPNPEGSYLVGRMTLDDKILTGTWQEEASPTGKYTGQTYYGAAQLILDDSGNKLTGKVVLYNHEMQIITGDWTLTKTSDQ